MTDLLLIPRFVPCLAFFFAVLLAREVVSFRRILPAKYILTPFVTLSIISFALLSASSAGFTRYTILVTAALLLSLVADTLLMVEEISLFRQGVVFFFLTHLCYIAAFSIGYSFQPWHAAMILVIPAGLVLFYRRLSFPSAVMKLMIVCYMAAIGSMCFFAFSHLGAPWDRQSVLLPAGATLFFISDCILAINEFGGGVPHSTVLTWSLYAPGQLFIALSCFR